MRHPPHAMLAHFPIACWSLATLADLAGLHYGHAAWQLAGNLLWIGLAFALPTLLLGMFELIHVPDGHKPMRTAFAHMGLMTLAFMLYLASLLMRMDNGQIHAPDTLALTTSTVGLVVLLTGGWLAGSLVYGYGAGRAEVASARPETNHRNPS